MSFEIEKTRPKASYVDFLNLGVNWQQTRQLNGISGQLAQMQELQLIGTSQVLGKLEYISKSLSDIGSVLNDLSSIQWQILSHFKEEAARQEILGRMRLNLHNIKREVVMLAELGKTKPFFALYQMATLINLLENSGWELEHFARESFADLEAAQEIHDLLENSEQIILDQVGANNPEYDKFEAALNEIYTLLHNKAIRKLEIEEFSSRLEYEYSKACEEIQANEQKMQQGLREVQQMQRVLKEAGLDVNSDKKPGFFKQISIGIKLANSNNSDIIEKIEAMNVEIAKMKMFHDRAQMSVAPGGYFYESEQELLRLKKQQEDMDGEDDERIDKLGRDFGDHLP